MPYTSVQCPSQQFDFAYILQAAAAEEGLITKTTLIRITQRKSRLHLDGRFVKLRKQAKNPQNSLIEIYKLSADGEWPEQYVGQKSAPETYEKPPAVAGRRWEAAPVRDCGGETAPAARLQQRKADLALPEHAWRGGDPSATPPRAGLRNTGPASRSTQFLVPLYLRFVGLILVASTLQLSL